MIRTYYQLNQIAALPGSYTVGTVEGAYDYVEFDASYVTKGRTTTNLGVMGPQGMSTVVNFLGTDGLARQVTFLGVVERLDGGRTSDVITGNALGNFICGDTPFLIHGAADTIRGGDGSDTLYGYVGNDKIFGDNGNDFCLGGAGQDTLWGGWGKDYLIGGEAADVLYGGKGADVFLFALTLYSNPAGMDVIMDFSSAEGDIIDLRQIDAHPGREGDQAFRLITGEFTGGLSELRVRAVTGGVMVEGDINRNKVADFAVMVQGVTGLEATDFVL